LPSLKDVTVMKSHQITADDLERAHEQFERIEPRALFYRAATILVVFALDGELQSLTLGEALAVLLKTWNATYYRFHEFNDAHLKKIEKILSDKREALEEYRKRSIDSLKDEEKEAVAALFQEFENILGPVGAAKSLHLLAPHLFPLWDREIATAYGIQLKKAGANGDNYWDFMVESRRQCAELKECPNTLKAIDEYNYCEFTLKKKRGG
jgi:hypothetical protein